MVNILWWEAGRGNWDHGLLQSIFDKYPNLFIQYNSKDFQYFESAVVIVSGKPEVEPLRKYLESLKEGIVILTSEEDGYFDFKSAIPPNMETWTSYFTESKREIKTRLLIGTPNRIKDYKINSHLPKKYLWSFIGQVQNPFRQQCVAVLKTLPDGFLHIADSFGGIKNGIEYQNYLDIMCQSKYVICPSGSMCCDSFRVYEAIECGAVPIADVRSPRDKDEFDYWFSVLGDYAFFPTIKSWSELYISDNTDGFEMLQKYVSKEWNNYKNKLEQNLLNIAHGKDI